MYSSKQLVWRELPIGWRQGISTKYKPDKEGADGWWTTYTETGKEIHDTKTHLQAQDAVHARQSEFVLDDIAKRLRTAGIFGDSGETLSVADRKERAAQLERDRAAGTVPRSPSPGKTRRITNSPCSGASSGGSPLAYLRKSRFTKSKRNLRNQRQNQQRHQQKSSRLQRRRRPLISKF